MSEQWSEEQRRMAERILKRWAEKPELLDQLLQSLQEEPVLWEDSNESNSQSDTGSSDQKPG